MAVKKVTTEQMQEMTGTKQKVTTKAKGKSKAKTIKASVDEELKQAAESYGKLDIELKSLQETNPIFSDHAEAKKKLLTLLDDNYPADKGGKVSGSHYGTDFTVKKSSSEFVDKVNSMKEVHKLLGDDAFYQIISITQKQLKDYLPAKKVEAMIKTENTGARTVKGFKV